MRFTLLSLLLVVPGALAEDNTEPKDAKVEVREIKVKGLPTVERGPMKDTKITSKEDLEKAVTDKDAREAIEKQVNFKKEFLVLYQWSGSGQDKLEFKAEKGTVTFTRKLGFTRDLRQHARLFALPLKTEYKLAK